MQQGHRKILWQWLTHCPPSPSLTGPQHSYRNGTIHPYSCRMEGHLNVLPSDLGGIPATGFKASVSQLPNLLILGSTVKL